MENGDTPAMKEWRKARGPQTLEERRTRSEALEKLPLTEEEKKRWAPMFSATWGAIAADVEGKLTRSLIVEMVIDANRVQMYGDMTNEEYAFLSVVYHRPSGQRWLRSVMNFA